VSASDGLTAARLMVERYDSHLRLGLTTREKADLAEFLKVL
jgi:hypothetical protein